MMDASEKVMQLVAQEKLDVTSKETAHMTGVRKRPLKLNSNNSLRSLGMRFLEKLFLSCN